MVFWKQIPIFRLLVALVLGIVAEWYGDVPFYWVVLLAALVVVLLLLISLIQHRKRTSANWLNGLCIQLCFALLGMALVWKADDRHQPNWSGYLKDSTATTFLLTLREPLIEKSKTYKALCTIDAIYKNNSWERSIGHAWVYFSKEPSEGRLHYGSQLVCHARLEPIKNLGNPGGFDYEQFARFQNIHFRVFLTPLHYQLTAADGGHFWMRTVFSIRDSILQQLKKYISNPTAQGIAEALLMGYRNDLDSSLVQAYSQTGVVHIIAISGMHLGLIYLVLVGCFSVVRNKKVVRYVRPVVVLGVMWMFCLCTGAGASILRSGVMFSVILIGELLSKKSSVYNSLFLSAFLLLLYNPYLLWDVGFQLSYAAVFSIVLFSKPILRWLEVQNKLLLLVWELVAVTIAAQIGTLPLLLFYFHQFSAIFILSNIVAVPLSTLILFAEIGLVMVSPFASIAGFIGVLTTHAIDWMNTFIKHLNGFDFLVWGYIKIEWAQVLLLYSLIVGMGLWWMRFMKKGFWIALISLLFFVSYPTLDKIQRAHQQVALCYHLYKGLAIDYFEGNHVYFMGDSDVNQNLATQTYTLWPARTLHRASPSDQVPLGMVARPPFYFIGQKTVLIIEQPYHFSVSKKIPIDYILLSNNVPISIAELLNSFACSQFILSADNKASMVKRWENECVALRVQWASVSQGGAYAIAIKK